MDVECFNRLLVDTIPKIKKENAAMMPPKIKLQVALTSLAIELSYCYLQAF